MRLANIRKLLSTQDERQEKLRQERNANRRPTGFDRTILGVLKGLQANEGEAKKTGR